MNLGIYLSEGTIEEGLPCDELLKKLQDSKPKEVAFFDQMLDGYVRLQMEAGQYPTNTILDLAIQGSMGEIINLANVKLETVFSQNATNVVYKFSIFLSYPKFKLDAPQIKLKAQSTLIQKAQIEEKANSEATSLSDYYPAERRNILGEIMPTVVTRQNRFLAKESILPDSFIRHNKVEVPEDERHVQQTTHILTEEISLPALRTLNIRVRNIKIKDTSILSTIDVELSRKFKTYGIPITLNGIIYRFKGNSGPKSKNSFPIVINEDDSYSFTFQLDSNESISYKTMIDVDYSIRTNNLKTKWITNIDFNSAKPKRASTSSLPLPPSNVLSNGLHIDFIGKKEVKLGEVFKLKAHILNYSKKNRNLVMVFNSVPESYQANLPKIKSHILSNLNILKSYTSSKIKTTGILSLVNEVHFKVNSDQVFESDILLIGLEVGVFNLTGVKLVDLVTGENMNCDKLLQVIVLE